MRFLAACLIAPAAVAQSHFRTVESHSVALPSSSPSDFAAADIDGDGDADLLATYDDRTCQLFVNDGRGRFANVSLGQLPPLALQAVAADFADIDSDGDVDMLLAVDDFLVQRVLRNDGSGRFTDDVAAAAGVQPAGAVADQIVVDLDGDGDQDWVLVDELGGVRTYFNDGSGRYAQAGATVRVSLMPKAYGADVDLDGDTDLIIGSRSSFGRVSVLLNDGAGGLTLAVGAVPAAVRGNVLVLDADGDGRVDVLVGRRLLLGSASGFLDAPAGSVPSSGFTVSIALDVDRDGDLDVLGGGVMLINDGTGVFALESMPNVNGPMIGVDTDVDGDLDLVSGSSYLVNFTRQATAGVPAAGFPWSLSFQGLDPDGRAGPAASYLVAIGLAPSQARIPGLGVLGLDLASAEFMGAIAAPMGRGGLAIPVPLNPALRGLDVYAQGVGLPGLGNSLPIGLTNTVRQTVQ